MTKSHKLLKKTDKKWQTSEKKLQTYVKSHRLVYKSHKKWQTNEKKLKKTDKLVKKVTN